MSLKSVWTELLVRMIMGGNNKEVMGSGLKIYRGFTHTHGGSTHAHTATGSLVEDVPSIPPTNPASANPIRVDSYDFDWDDSGRNKSAEKSEK